MRKHPLMTRTVLTVLLLISPLRIMAQETIDQLRASGELVHEHRLAGLPMGSSTLWVFSEHDARNSERGIPGAVTFVLEGADGRVADVYRGKLSSSYAAATVQGHTAMTVSTDPDTYLLRLVVADARSKRIHSAATKAKYIASLVMHRERFYYSTERLPYGVYGVDVETGRHWPVEGAGSGFQDTDFWLGDGRLYVRDFRSAELYELIDDRVVPAPNRSREELREVNGRLADYYYEDDCANGGCSCTLTLE
jgi:hypothetical protein